MSWPSNTSDYRKQKELEEARKQGRLAPEKDAEGNDINPHIPEYIKNAPCVYIPYCELTEQGISPLALLVFTINVWTLSTRKNTTPSTTAGMHAASSKDQPSPSTERGLALIADQ